MKKAILLSIVLAGTLFSVKPQSYPKAPGAIRLLTYNTHYCKGGYDPGEINESNVKKLAQVIKALDADVIALQELDSASQSRGNRYLLHEIAKHTGIEYTDVYANAARFDKKGSIGCGALVRKNLPIVSRYIAYLPGDEPRAAIQLELEKFVFIATHSDLNNEKRRQGTKIICNDKNRSREESEIHTNLSHCVTQRYSGSARKAEELNQEKHKKVLTTEYYYPPALRTHMR